MAENKEGQEKTEQPTGKKLQDSREKGQVAKSMEINSVAVFSAGLLIIFFTKGFIGEKFFQLSTYIWGSLNNLELNISVLKILATQGLLFFLLTLSPIFIGLILTAFAATYGQVGFQISAKALKPKFDKLNPLSGVKNLFFSTKSFVEISKAVVKLSIVGLFVWVVLKDTVLESISLIKYSVPQIVAFMIDTLISFLWKVALVYFALGIVDFIYQKRKHVKDLMMTKQEVKDEYKQSEGDPQIKGQIKSKQIEMARSRMMKDVETADVVITNPTHYAVALKYEVGGSDAPKVVAKGADRVAQRIKKIAAEFGVPTHEDVFLARALYRVCEIGDIIPENLYKAVAQVLAYVYKVKNEKKKSIV